MYTGNTIPCYVTGKGSFKEKNTWSTLSCAQVGLEEINNGEEKVSDASYLYHHFWGYPGSCIADLFHSVRKYDTKEITYTVNGSEKTRTVVDPDSFQYILDEDGNKVTQAAPIFGTEDFAAAVV